MSRLFSLTRGKFGFDAAAVMRRWPLFRAGIIVFAVASILGMWGAGAAYLRYAAQSQVEYTYRINENLAAAFAAHTAQAIREIEGIMRVTAREYRRQGRHFDLRSFAEAAHLSSRFVVALIIVDREGKVVQTNIPDFPVKSYADSEHFRVHVAGGEDRLYSGRPVVGRYLKDQVLPFSLRISGPGGEFLGVVITGVNPHYFINLYQKIDIGNKGVVTLFGLDGFIRARLAAGEIGVGQDVRKAPIVRQAQQSESGRTFFAAVVDGVMRHYSFQRIAGYPLAIAVGQAEEEALAGIRRIIRAALIGGVIITLLMIAATVLLLRGFDVEHRMLASLQARTAELAEANRELETFAYSVSHDLKAPLRGIDGYSQLLLENHGRKLDEEGLRFLHNVRQGAHNMNQLIEDLLAYSRIERGEHALQVLDIKPLVEALVQERRSDPAAADCRIGVAVPALEVTADREGMIMVLRNLLDNAVKFSARAAGPRVEVGGRDNGSSCILWVRDNGIGFDMKYHDRIFGIFERLHRAEDFPGTGVGLAIVRKAMNRMGGRVRAESAPGQGVAFDIEIPKRAETA